MRTAKQIANDITEVEIALDKDIRALRRAAKEKIAALEKEMKQASQAAVVEARQQIIQILSEHHLDAETVLASLAANKRASRAPLPEPTVHYVGPQGQIWKGRGKHPLWLKGQDKAQFERAGAAPQ